MLARAAVMVDLFFLKKRVHFIGCEENGRERKKGRAAYDPEPTQAVKGSF
jgi:hypothetical protein